MVRPALVAHPGIRTAGVGPLPKRGIHRRSRSSSTSWSAKSSISSSVMSQSPGILTCGGHGFRIPPTVLGQTDDLTIRIFPDDLIAAHVDARQPSRMRFLDLGAAHQLEVGHRVLDEFRNHCLWHGRLPIPGKYVLPRKLQLPSSGITKLDAMQMRLT
ncbi:hypothetical protein Kim5_CH00806 [Rhizobium sp. Kim5]|nr:hypothetical protein Kim5_CH00806 [Rhizobium sp. Kim5]